MEVDQIKPAIAAARQQASQATQAFLDQYGDADCCGYAWVKVHDVKLSTKVGKAFAAAGFSKAYGGGIEFWNPSGSSTQSLTAKEKGADAFVKELRARFPGINAYSGSRMD